MKRAIEILEDALYSAQCNLKMAQRHIEKQPHSRPEFYRQAIKEIQSEISDIESALQLLKFQRKLK